MAFSFSLPWWLYAGVAFIIVWPLIQRLIEELIQERRFARAGLSDIRRMHWRDFEKYLAHLFRSLGYQAEVTPAQGDFGIDVILTDSSGNRIAVQAKHWKGKRVGSPEVQKTIGGADYYNCPQKIIVTTSGYTDAARQMARKTGVQLWGLKELGDALQGARSRGAAAQTEVAAAAQTPPAPTPVAAPRPAQKQALGMPVKRTPSAPAGPPCPQCGGLTVERMAEGRRVWLCARFPACKGIRMSD